jgi:hypothetical protein
MSSAFPLMTDDEVTDVIGSVFSRWDVWHDTAGWHARRQGRFREVREAGAAAYALHYADPVELVRRMDAQDQIPPPDGWDTR